MPPIQPTLLFNIPTTAPDDLFDTTTGIGQFLRPPTVVSKVYFDTFDWRLYTAGYILILCEQSLTLIEITTWQAICSLPWTRKKPPTFVETIPPSALREKLTSLLAMRSLIPMAQAIFKQQAVEIKNKYQKTTVRLLFEHIVREEGTEPFQNSASIQPLRGYQKNAQKVRNHLLRQGCIAIDHRVAITKLFQEFDCNPGDYSTKITLAITSNRPLLSTAVELFNSQLAVMRYNETGILEDIDTECLHDFRVALRRTRAGLSEIKGIFSTEKTIHFKEILKELANQTNHLRDLDVYLLKQEYYKSLLPQQLQKELGPLFTLLKKERQREKQKISRLLRSPTYASIVSQWQEFLDTVEDRQDDHGPKAQVPTREQARKYLFKRWRTALKKGRSITIQSEDEALHELRLCCKKLRYMVEFFASLFPQKKINALIRQLKRLQNNLGDFNDLCVQQQTLQEYLNTQMLDATSAVATAAAIGGLLAGLNREQQKVRKQFAKAFQGFDHYSTDKRINTLLAT